MDRNDSNKNESHNEAADKQQDEDSSPVEIGGQSGPEPTRFGDWEKNGRCTDF